VHRLIYTIFAFLLLRKNQINARGFTTGKIFSMEGKLIASVTQEGLMRPMLKK
jgi:acyl-CoA thioesterase